jgi:hypothetical protein
MKEQHEISPGADKSGHFRTGQEKMRGLVSIILPNPAISGHGRRDGGGSPTGEGWRQEQG